MSGYVWANATVQSSNADVDSHYIYTYLKIGNYTSPVTIGTMITADCYSALQTPLQFRTPVPLGPTGAVPIQLFAFSDTRVDVSVNQATLFSMGNLN